MYLLTMHWNEETEGKKALQPPILKDRSSLLKSALVHSLINTSDKHHLVLLPQQNFLFSNKDQTT